MNPFAALVAVAAIAAAAWFAALLPSARLVAAGILPAAAAVIFLVGITWRVLRWAGSPVPFRIPLTGGQQRSLPWLKAARLDNPSTTAGVLGRMALEILLFRSLMRQVRADVHAAGRLIFRDSAALWLAALAFHYSLLVIAVRHLRLVTQPVPDLVTILANADSFFRLGVPSLYASDVVLFFALGWLLTRRLREPQLRYLSLFPDYFVLLLLLAIATTGLLMRHYVRVDVVAVKEVAMSLATLSSPKVSPSLHPLVFVHLTLVSVFVASFPFTKLVHMAGVFLSPTRNLANDSRAHRHVNRWNAPVSVHSYEQWEDEFRDKLIAAGLPLDGSGDRV